jgi:IS5 family transposase
VSRSYCNKTKYEVQDLKNAKIADTEESVFSSIKRSLGVALRARAWYREFRELALMCAVYNVNKAAQREIPLPSGD